MKIFGFAINVWNYILSWFIRKEEGEYPPEFAVVKYTDSAKKAGIFMEESKEIILYHQNSISGEHEPVREFNYAQSKIEAFLDKGTPVLDTTKQKFSLPTMLRQKPEIMTYEEDVE